ncbi:MAG: DNA cytosine methyltransferase [Mucilaginibacter sp.]
MDNITVIDLFCGAGGFSEGFRQQGFEIVNGYDYWKPAIDTYSHNFGENKGILTNILNFKDNIDLIEALPDTDVILGSPPCVSFSSSNRSGKADKSMGVTLTETFLKIVAVKKFHPNSKLKAWFMENVTNSTNYLAREYNFQDLGLYEWAKKYRISPTKVAIKIEGNSIVINSAEYGCPQSRKRVITGEIISKEKLIIPEKTHGASADIFEPNLLQFKTLGFLKSKLPKPNEVFQEQLVNDPLYSYLSIKQSELSDHFYDTGLYECEWKNSRFLKINHPYMGFMSFPENETKPSRTITATKIGTSRESIIYKSEYNRIGNGEFRTPTVREAACIMGFPITYQFIGSEGTKWRLVGNAVCATVSRTFAGLVRQELKLPVLSEFRIQQTVNLNGVNNLNTYTAKKFNSTPKRAIGSRFRRHPFKEGNLTVTLSNYDIIKNDKEISKWLTSIQYGNGEGFPHDIYPDNFYKDLEPIISKFENGNHFLKVINNGFAEKIANSEFLQQMYEQQQNLENFLEPTQLVESVANLINDIKFKEPLYKPTDNSIFKKELIPKKQILALYAINKISTKANCN